MPVKLRIAFNISLFCLLLLIPGPLGAAEQAVSGSPIHVEADRMVSRQKENAVIFTGNVEAKQEGLTINADEMTVFHNNEAAADTPDKGTSQKIQKLFADGNVKITKEGLVATGDHMEFFSEERKVLLTGDTKAWQGNNLVTGDKILLDLATETTIIEPDKEGGGRVKFFFNPGTE